MGKQALTLDTELRQRQISSPRNGGVPYIHIPLLVRFTALLFLGLVMLILGVATVGHMETSMQILNLSSRYLPGNVLPGNTTCYTPNGEHTPRCFVQFEDHEVYFDYDANTRIITGIVIPVQEYTLGMLIAAWGTPTGNTLDQYAVYVYWYDKAAFLYTPSIQPDSRVDFILYGLEPQQSSPWHGFRNSKEHR